MTSRLHTLELPRVALVTGGSRGLGRAIALGLAELGCAVAVNYRADTAAADATLAELANRGVRAQVFCADVSHEDEVRGLVTAVEAELGAIDILVNNAGIGPPCGVFEADLAHWDAVQGANLRSAFLVSQAVIAGMAERGWGRLLFLSSIAAHVGGVVSPAYAASKAGMEGLMHFYALHLRERGVTANAIAPALIESDMVHALNIDPAQQPLGRFGRPEEVAMLAQTLVCNGFLTGQTLHLNAGRYMS